MAEQKKKEINQRVKDQKGTEQLNTARDNLSVVKGEAASLKDLIEENPTLALKSVQEHEHRVSDVLLQHEGVFMKFELRVSDITNMIQVTNSTVPLVGTRSIKTEKVRNYFQLPILSVKLSHLKT